VKGSVDDVHYACNMRINLQTKSRMRQLAEADWEVRMVEPKHASISHAMGKRKTLHPDDFSIINAFNK